MAVDFASSLNSTESRALTLLGQGLSAEIVASAVGVSPSRISQLISDPNFAAAVAELRFAALAKHNERDNSYDSLEDSLLERMKNLLPMMYKPMEVLKALAVINAAKRRGQSAPESITQQNTVVQLVMPTQIINNFSAPQIETNINNQVIKAGETDLITVQSSSMNKLLESRKGVRNANVSEAQLLPTPAN